MRLSNYVAARRRLYPRPVPTLPDIVLLDVPAGHAGEQLPLGRYYPILLETDAEALELDAFLAEDRAELVAPALFDRRPSVLATSRITLARYAPSASDWPWILLCHWPADLAALATQPDSFARNAYTVEIFPNESELSHFSRTMLATLQAGGVSEPTLVLPGAIGGSA